jgi:hypothetical protein
MRPKARPSPLRARSVCPGALAQARGAPRDCGGMDDEESAQDFECPAFAVRTSPDADSRPLFVGAQRLRDLDAASLRSHLLCRFALAGPRVLALAHRGGAYAVLPDSAWPLLFLEELMLDAPDPDPPFFVWLLASQEARPHLAYVLPVVDEWDVFLFRLPGIFLFGAGDARPPDLARPLLPVLDIARAQAQVFDVTGTAAVLDGLDFSAFVHNLLCFRYYISVTIPDGVRRMVRKRRDGIAEFLDSEAKHLAFLRGLGDAVAPVMAALGVPTFVDRVKSICQAHEQIAAAIALSRVERDFYGCLGQALEKIIQCLHLYVDYQRDFDKADQLCATADSYAFRTAVSDFDNGPFAQGQSLQSVLMMPVQRPPRIRLQLEQVRQVTPPQHPDYKPLEHACGEIEKAVSTINREAGAVGRQTELTQICDSIIDRNPEQWSDPTLTFRKHFDAVGFRLLVFAGQLRVLKTLSNGRFLLCGIYPFHEIAIREINPTLISITGKLTHDFQLRAPDPTVLESFKKAALDSGGDTSYRLELHWISVHSARITVREGHALFFAKSRLWIYGGRRRSGELTFLIETVDGGDHLLYPNQPFRGHETPPCSGFAAVQNGDSSFFVFGGKGRMGKSFADLWEFSFETCEWEQFRQSGGPPAMEDKRPAMAIIGENLVVTQAGMLYQFNLQTKQWFGEEQELGFDVVHLFAIDTATAIALVGTTEAKVYIIELGKLPKELSITGWPPGLQSRGCVKCKNSIFVFGDDNDSIIMELDLITRRWIPERRSASAEPVPRMLGYAVCSNDEVMWMHGGSSTTGRITGQLYRIEIRDDRFTQTKPEPLSFTDV